VGEKLVAGFNIRRGEGLRGLMGRWVKKKERAENGKEVDLGQI